MHFHHHGRHEGRFASQHHLDCFFDDRLFERLQREVRDVVRLSVIEQRYLNWLIARRHATRSDWPAVVDALGNRAFKADLDPLSPFSHLPRLLYCDALCRLGQTESAYSQLEWSSDLLFGGSDQQLMAANLLHQNESLDVWLSTVNELYLNNRYLPLSLAGQSPNLDKLNCQHSVWADGPLVSVLMAAWNAETSLDTALSGLLNQTHRNLEVIVVDDASTDDTAAIVKQWAKLDARVRLLQHKTNLGTYVARNWAIEEARGEFITVHDSDDWSHPQKLSTQVRALMGGTNLKATLSAWVRVSDDLYFGEWETPASWHGWVHQNTSSLMMRRGVFQEIGYWDEVRCSADTEYMCRIQAQWGPESIRVVAPHLPLAFGRLSSRALTRTPETHLLTALKGVRHDYACAYRAWHARASSQGTLYVARSPVNRPFEIADTMHIRQIAD